MRAPSADDSSVAVVIRIRNDLTIDDPELIQLHRLYPRQFALGALEIPAFVAHAIYERRTHVDCLIALVLG